MKYEKIKDKLCCPFDKSDLALDVITMDKEKELVIEGILSCNSCRRIYPIISGIPIMTPDEFREEALEKPLLDKWQSMLGGAKVNDFRLTHEKE